MQDKTPGTRENTDAMRDRLYCHFDIVRWISPDKPSWNLDTWRPHTSYANLIAHQCNN